jgi:hypothetical protein
MRLPTDAAIAAEAAVLDAIHRELRGQANVMGLTIAQLAERTGIAAGRLREVLNKSEVCLRRIRHTQRYKAFWDEIEPEYRPLPLKPWAIRKAA